jgi:hypothetical protein
MTIAQVLNLKRGPLLPKLLKKLTPKVQSRMLGAARTSGRQQVLYQLELEV